MWMLLGGGALILIFLFWGYSHLTGAADEAKGAQDEPGENRRNPTIQTDEQSFADGKAITYTLTRVDLMANHAAVTAHNRVMQIIALGGLLLFEGLALAATRTDSLVASLSVFLAILVGWIAVFAIAMGLAIIAIVFLLQHRGVLGKHTLEITERGLLESTDFNETLVKWNSIRRIRSTRWFLYIYVNDLQFHAVPKRYFSKEQIDNFESVLRTRAKGMK